ncbi:MAG TPA: class I SAM-dependent methyltransferase [Terriglobales bacterium]|nr:class I SAM-dependent methyltransferase [Terriglobales bacterium]
MAAVPDDFDALVALACRRAAPVAGYMGEHELRGLLMLAAAAPLGPAKPEVMVEIGSFKGKSAVALATLVQQRRLPPLVSIDPHTAPSVTDPGLPEASSFEAFTAALAAAGVSEQVEVHRQRSQEAAVGWNRPIGLLWIDGDHTWEGARSDFDLFSPFLVPGAFVALHDSLHFFEGPIRVFVERMLADDRFGPAGFLHSIAWAQYRPADGVRWREERTGLARRARRVLARVAPPAEFHGLNKLRYKLACARTPHRVPRAEAWFAGLDKVAD